MSSERNLVGVGHQRCCIPTGWFRLLSLWLWGRGCGSTSLRCVGASWLIGRRSRASDWVHARKREFSPLLLHPVLPRNRIHPQTPFNHQHLPDLNTVLQVLSQVAPTNHLQLTWWIIRAQTIETNRHFRDRRLVVLGVSEGGCLEHLHFQHAVIHSACRSSATS